MTTLTEQFSAVRKSQVETQINFFQSYTAKALESTQKILALNLNASRASMEKSAAAMVDLLAAKDPRDLFGITKRTQESIDGLLAYNRALLAIATGGGSLLTQPAPLAYTKPEPEVAEPAEAAEAATPAVQFDAPLAEPDVPQSVADILEAATPVPAEATAIAQAVSQVADKPMATKPAAAPLPKADKPVVVKGLKPVDATPPPAPAAGTPSIAQQQLDLPAAKGKKKK